eukprot:snap_masked-scaffold_12-processed-gene-2.17-mRNA-1 protein AED:1.00 eAED:1.00 QI:0/0/0/0/1/1/3/0/603
MKKLFVLWILKSIFIGVYSWAQVPLITGNFTYKTTRYSNFIGDFDEDCSITAPMVKLGPFETLCDLETIETNISGYVLVTFGILNYGCYEENAYENAIKLGAVALIDAVGIPPGSFHSVHNARQCYKKGSIPFLQVGTEFFGTFGIEGISPAFDLLTGTPIHTEGCADKTPIIKCYNVYQVLLILFSFTAVFGLYIAYKALRRLRVTPSSRPRVTLIVYEALVLFLTSILFFFGLDLRQAKNLLDGSIVSAQGKDTLGTLQLVCSVHTSLVSAIYWNALRKGCFIKESKTPEYWRRHFFLSPWQFIAFGVSIFLFLELSTTLDNFYKGDIDDFETLLRLLIWSDVLCGVILFFSMIYFILTLRKIIPNSKYESVSSTPENFKSKLNFIWNTVQTLLRGQTISLKKENPGSSSFSGVNAKLLQLSFHLSKWLTFYVIIMIISSCLILFGFFNNLPFGVLQDDPDGCKAYSFYYAYICVKLFTSHCKIIGLGGPSSSEKKQPESKLRSLNPVVREEDELKGTKLSSIEKDPNNTKHSSILDKPSQYAERSAIGGNLTKRFEPVSRKVSFDESILRPSEGRGLIKFGYALYKKVQVFFKTGESTEF